MKLNSKHIVKLKDGTEVVLRSPTPDDALKYIQFLDEIFKSSKFTITQADEYDTNIESQKTKIKSILNKKNNIIIIAEFNEKIIGNIDFKSNPERKRIKHRGEFGMSVLPSWQGKGLGKLLLKTLIEWCKQKDNEIEKIELRVVKKNLPALNLYKKLGFIEEGTVSGEIKTSENKYLDTLIMGLWIYN